MPLNKTRIQQYLRDFNFRQLFIEELGWDNPPTAVEVTVDGQRHALSAIAHKRGMVAYPCGLLWILQRSLPVYSKYCAAIRKTASYAL